MRLPAKATHAQTRQHNQRLVLRTVYDFGPISRAEVARSTGLTRTTVGDVVGELLDEGMVEEVGRGPSTGGKSPILLSIIGDARQVIGLDLGESVFSGALVNLRGDVRRVVEQPVDGRNGDAALDLVFGLVDELLSESTSTPLGIGVGTPGLVDTRTGTIRWAVNLDWQDLPLGGLLHERYGLPSNVANDSQAAALAEYTFGAEGQRAENLVTIKVGRGSGRASSSTARCSRATASAPARSATSRSSTTARPAAAGGSAAWRPSRAAGRSRPVPRSWPRSSGRHSKTSRRRAS